MVIIYWKLTSNMKIRRIISHQSKMLTVLFRIGNHLDVGGFIHIEQSGDLVNSLVNEDDVTNINYLTFVQMEKKILNVIFWHILF